MVWRAFILIKFIVDIVIYYFKIKSNSRADLLFVIITYSNSHSFNRQLSQRANLNCNWSIQNTVNATPLTFQMFGIFFCCSNKMHLLWNLKRFIFSIFIYFPTRFLSIPVLLFRSYGKTSVCVLDRDLSVGCNIDGLVLCIVFIFFSFISLYSFAENERQFRVRGLDSNDRITW